MPLALPVLQRIPGRPSCRSREIVIPDTNTTEVAVVEHLEVIPVSSLAEAVAFFCGHIEIDPSPRAPAGVVVQRARLRACHISLKVHGDAWYGQALASLPGGTSPARARLQWGRLSPVSQPPIGTSAGALTQRLSGASSLGYGGSFF